VGDLADLGSELARAAEPGFFERRTHDILAARFRSARFSVADFHGMPGFVATDDGRPGGRELVVIADMDALPAGDGYAHLCGHHQQMTVMYGVALRLRERAPHLLPRIAFVATPAEEYVELERREALRESGAVRWLSGKQELIERGIFQGTRWAIATHAARLAPRTVNSVVAMNGFEHLRFTFQGRSAHAGATPHLGRNAQNAAALFLQACAFLRETFDEARHVRIHPVLRLRPGQAVNLIPDEAMVETYARAADVETVDDTVERLTLAAEGCARAIGVGIATVRVRGYAPFRVDPLLHDALRGVAEAAGAGFEEDAFSAASSDMGDLSRVVPSIIVGLPGSNGRLHETDFAVTDAVAAYDDSADLVAALVVRVLEEQSRS